MKKTPLSPTTSIPAPSIPLNKGSVPLNQPFPKELANAPLVGIAEQVGQAALEKSIKKTLAEKNGKSSMLPNESNAKMAGAVASAAVAGFEAGNSEPGSKLEAEIHEPKDQERDDKNNMEENKESEKLIGGYAAADLIKAPIKSPEPKEKDSKRATSNPVVKSLVTIGVILVALGLVFTFLLNLFFGIVLMVLGSVAIIACVFLPVGVKQ